VPKKLTTAEFVHRARKIHGTKYDYSKTVYEGSKKNVIIICPIHGEFLQPPQRHFKCICRKCAYVQQTGLIKIDKSEFIIRAKRIHKGKYDYSELNYNGLGKKPHSYAKNMANLSKRPKATSKVDASNVELSYAHQKSKKEN
jgi:hypothetical protein